MGLIVTPPGEQPRSVLPAGGCPGDDRNYIAWRDAYLVELADRVFWYDRPEPRGLEAWRFDAHLYAVLSDNGLFDAITNYAHRLRYLSLCYRTRRCAVLAAARRFSFSLLVLPDVSP